MKDSVLTFGGRFASGSDDENEILRVRAVPAEEDASLLSALR